MYRASWGCCVRTDSSTPLTERRGGRTPRRIAAAIRAVVTMSWPERREVVVVCFVALTCECTIRSLSLPQLARLFRVHLVEDPTYGAVDDLDLLPEWARARLRVARRVMRNWPVEGVCLRHSLVAGQRLRTLQPVLKVGVARRNGAVVAHAWLAIDGLNLDVFADEYHVLPMVLR